MKKVIARITEEDGLQINLGNNYWETVKEQNDIINFNRLEHTVEYYRTKEEMDFTRLKNKLIECAIKVENMGELICNLDELSHSMVKYK